MKTRKLLVIALIASSGFPAQARLLESADNVHFIHGDADKSSQIYVSKVASEKKNSQISLKEEAKLVLKKITTWFSSSTKEPEIQTSSEVQTASIATAPVEVKKIEPEVIAVQSPVSEDLSGAQLELSTNLAKTQKIVRETQPLVEANPGRPGTSVLPKTKMGVPNFSLSTTKKRKLKSGRLETIKVHVKEIPLLDIGLEKSILASEFLPPEGSVVFEKGSKTKTLDSPPVFSQKKIIGMQKNKIPTVAKAKKPKRGDFELGQMVTQQKIAEVNLDMKDTQPLEKLKPYKQMSTDDITMLVALSYYDKGKCHLVSGLLYNLSKKSKHDEEANYYLGICAHKMGFHSEAVSRLVKVIATENSDFTTGAITSLVEDLPKEYDSVVVSVLKKLKNTSLIEDKAKDNINYIYAREAHEKNNYAKAATYAALVSENSSHYLNAQYMRGIALYGDKKEKQAEQALLSLREWMSKKKRNDKNIEALIAVNLARMRFTQNRFQPAYDEYMKVPKDHPMWVQALIEQGWTQLGINDPEGAIGNMYSLHSPYFKSVFMPESWVVRTIGYLDICQYGDAYRTLTKLEQLHGEWKTQVGQYMNKYKSPSQYYSTVKNYLKGTSSTDVDGLPHQVIREIARQRGFLNAQNAINVKEDEIAQYSFVYRIIKQDQLDLKIKMDRIQKRLAETKANIHKAKTNSDLVKFANEWNAQRRLDEQLLSSYSFQKLQLEKARKGFLVMHKLSLNRIEAEKNILRNQAGQALNTHLADIRSRINQIIEGNEFLRYEVFSGSGENIRYQVSGGKTSDVKRIPANVKPQKILNWEFDGEYWEDEIGSYRSSLKNNCPKSSRVGQKLNAGKEQASINN